VRVRLARGALAGGEARARACVCVCVCAEISTRRCRLAGGAIYLVTAR